MKKLISRLKRCFGPAPVPARRPRSVLRAEALEPRLVPASFTMRPDAPSFAWNEPLTWSTDPKGPVPRAGDSVTIAGIRGNVTLGGAVEVASLSIGGDSRVTLSGGSLRTSSSIGVRGSEAAFDGVAVSAAGGLTVADGSDVTISGSLRSAGTVSVTGGSDFVLDGGDLTAASVAFGGSTGMIGGKLVVNEVSVSGGDVSFGGEATVRDAVRVASAGVAFAGRLTVPALEVGGDGESSVDLGGHRVNLNRLELLAGSVRVVDGTLVSAGATDLGGRIDLVGATVVAGQVPEAPGFDLRDAVVVNGPSGALTTTFLGLDDRLYLLADAAGGEEFFGADLAEVVVPKDGAFTLTFVSDFHADRVFNDGFLRVACDADTSPLYAPRANVVFNRGRLEVGGQEGLLVAEQLVLERGRDRADGGQLVVEDTAEVWLGSDHDKGIPNFGQVIVMPRRGDDRADRPALYIADGSTVTADRVTIWRDARVTAAGGTIEGDVSNSGTLRLATNARDEVGTQKGEALVVTGRFDHSGELNVAAVASAFVVTPGSSNRFNRPAMRVDGDVDLSGTLGLRADGGGPANLPPALGSRADLLGVGGELDGRFDRLDGVLGAAGDGAWHPVHYNRYLGRIQLLTTQEPIVRVPGGRMFLSERATAGVRANLVLIAPGSAATAAEGGVDGERVTGPDEDVYRIEPGPVLDPTPGLKLNRLWVADLANRIELAQLKGFAQDDWDVATLDWAWYATGIYEDRWHPEWRPITAARQAFDIGEGLVFLLEELRLQQAFGGISLYSHSAGSWLIDGFAEKRFYARNRSELYPRKGADDTFVHLTFFDAFNPTVYSNPLGVVARTGAAYFRLGESDTDITAWGTGYGANGEMGSLADWAVQYVDRRWVREGLSLTPALPLTDERLEHVATYDVTPLSPDVRTSPGLESAAQELRGFFNAAGGSYGEPLWFVDVPPGVPGRSDEARSNAHAWPTRYYRDSVTAFDSPGPARFGFPQAPEFTGVRPPVQARGDGPGERGSDIPLSAQFDTRSTRVPANTSPPAATPPAPAGGARPTPFYSGAAMVGPRLTLTGAGVPGGAQELLLPPGVFVFMADVRGDGVNDLVVVTPAAVAVLDGMTGTLSVLLIDADGDGRRELFLFNPDGTLAR